MTETAMLLLFVSCLLIAARLFLRPDPRPPVPPADQHEGCRPRHRVLARPSDD